MTSPTSSEHKACTETAKTITRLEDRGEGAACQKRYFPCRLTSEQYAFIKEMASAFHQPAAAIVRASLEQMRKSDNPVHKLSVFL